MTDRIRTLLIGSRGYGRRVLAADTLIGMFPRSLRAPLLAQATPDRHPLLWALLGDRYETMSYMLDWRDAFCRSRQLDVTTCNLMDMIEYSRRRGTIPTFDLIVLLHSATGDSMEVLSHTAGWLDARRGPLVVFMGNEYDLGREKASFLRTSGAEFVCSQLPLESAIRLYRVCEETRVLSMPHALNPAHYHPNPMTRREIDVGFVGSLYPAWIGDDERTRLIRYVQGNAARLGLRCDIRVEGQTLVPCLGPLSWLGLASPVISPRMSRAGWVKYLRRCHALVGAEAGTYFLDSDFCTLASAKKYCREHPSASFEEVYAQCFQGRRAETSGKAISSRHFEPIGTKTCQVLIEGSYNGILQPEVHYIPVRRDLSNVEEALIKSRDIGLKSAIAERAYEYVMAEHTHDARVRSLIQRVMG